jgi:hypothetical protein
MVNKVHHDRYRNQAPKFARFPRPSKAVRCPLANCLIYLHPFFDWQYNSARQVVRIRRAAGLWRRFSLRTFRSAAYQQWTLSAGTGPN